MIHIIPSVKTLNIKNGYLEKNSIFYDASVYDNRLVLALSKIPYDDAGTKLDIEVIGDTGEEYELWIDEQEIKLKANSLAGAFYGIQTLRQILKHHEVPCLYIKDKPDFAYRGFLHDVTRGRVPTVESIKKLIDKMAYYKLNSLQLNVEHTFEFEEYKDLNDEKGYLTKEEIKEIDAYCQENFIDFVPCLATFGHLYELLEQDKYKHLRVLKDYKNVPNFWEERQRHHTLDPLMPESIELVKSLIDQYVPHFTSEIFNICCDETFDLMVFEEKGYDSGKLYIDFVKQIVQHVKQKDKKVMMWADILLNHPEMIEELPDDTCFMNWDYTIDPSEEKIIEFAKLGRKQIVCPGTASWFRLCENITWAEKNICLMAEYGYKHGAVGVLNTNWGDWAHPCSLDLAMYGMVLGAEKSWSVSAEISDKFYQSINFLLYESENGVQYLKELTNMHDQVCWSNICGTYFRKRFGDETTYPMDVECDYEVVQKAYCELAKKLEAEKWKNDEYRQEMLIAAEGVCVIAELLALADNKAVNRLTNTKEWLEKYCRKWLEKNKRSELYRIEEMFLYLEEHIS